jgi:hypothetical protein
MGRHSIPQPLPARRALPPPMLKTVLLSAENSATPETFPPIRTSTIMAILVSDDAQELHLREGRHRSGPCEVTARDEGAEVAIGQAQGEQGEVKQF